jgi:hypothetical protein
MDPRRESQNEMKAQFHIGQSFKMKTENILGFDHCITGEILLQWVRDII